MRILVPLNNTDALDKYVEAGAGEFYIGFYDDKWSEKFGEYEDINRMSGYKKLANKNNIDDVCKIIKAVKEYNKMIYVAFNSSMYSQDELDYIRTYFELLSKTKVDGVIVSNIELTMMASEYNLNCVISTIAGVYNSDIAKFYAQKGASRIILPRDLSLDEIDKIVSRVTNVEYEVFIMRNGCIYSDSNCLGFHRQEMCSICGSISKADAHIVSENAGFKAKHDMELNDILYRDFLHGSACGLCSIYRFLQMGITACKVVGRSDDYEFVCQDITLINENIKIAGNSQSEEEYLENMVFPENSRHVCKLGLSCYYPEIRFS